MVRTIALLAIPLVSSPSASQERALDELLPELVNAKSVRITDSWIGLSPASPLQVEYQLERVGQEFSGPGRFSAGPPEWGIRDSAEIRVPSEAASLFLEILGRAEPRRGDYEPEILRTDDYPSISIVIETESGTVTFFSSSQGAGHAPWGMRHGDRTYMIESDLPDRALRRIRPYLKGEILGRLRQRARDR